jgi:nucleotidyltransferase/DNA polymerase involved in DNA repair
MTIIFHIDVNSAFLSWSAVEELKNGADRDLRKINAIVGGDQKSRHGIVLAKSQSAKRYGIRTGEPVANAFRKCSDLVVVPPDHRCYQEYSKRLMDLLRDYTPDIEQVSVDECFMDFTGIAHRFHSPIDGAMEIKNAVRDKFGFTVNVGISTNKLLAKMASDFEKPDKVHTLFPEEIQAKMWPLPVEDLFMAGRSSVETLHKLEMRTIGDVAQADPAILELHHRHTFFVSDPVPHPNCVIYHYVMYVQSIVYYVFSVYYACLSLHCYAVSAYQKDSSAPVHLHAPAWNFEVQGVGSVLRSKIPETVPSLYRISPYHY